MQRLVGQPATNQRERARVPYRVDRKIDVQIWPVKVMLGGELDVEDVRDRRVSKPRELVEGNEQLLASHEEPDTER